MRVVAAHRTGNTLHVLWEDGSEQTMEIVEFWDFFQQSWSRLFKHSFHDL